MSLLKNLNPESISHAHETSECRPCAAEAIADTEAEEAGSPHAQLTHLGNLDGHGLFRGDTVQADDTKTHLPAVFTRVQVFGKLRPFDPELWTLCKVWRCRS